MIDKHVLWLCNFFHISFYGDFVSNFRSLQTFEAMLDGGSPAIRDQQISKTFKRRSTALNVQKCILTQLIKSLLSPLPGTNQYWCHMKNHGCDPCRVWTHDPEVARQTPYPLGHRSQLRLINSQVSLLITAML